VRLLRDDRRHRPGQERHDRAGGELLPLEDLEAADWVDIGQPVPYDAEILQNQHVFLSQIEVTYTVPMDKLAPPPPPPPPEE